MKIDYADWVEFYLLGRILPRDHLVLWLSGECLFLQVKEELMDLIAGAQGQRLNEQRAPWAVLPGLTRSKQVNIEHLPILILLMINGYKESFKKV